MGTVALDIETVGAPGDLERGKAVLEMWEAAGGDRWDSPHTMAALSPALARIVSVALVGIDTGRQMVIYDSTLCGVTQAPYAVARDEEAFLLAEVNRALSKGTTRLVTFRGRGFDVPCLIHAMVANQMTPAPLLMAAFREPRYRPQAHIDLWELFTAYGAANGASSLRAWSYRYGVSDPKVHGSGSDVVKLVEAKEATKLVEYNLGDAQATADLYKAWRRVMSPGPGPEVNA